MFFYYNLKLSKSTAILYGDHDKLSIYGKQNNENTITTYVGISNFTNILNFTADNETIIIATN